MKRNLRQIVTEGLRLFYNDIKSARWAIILIVAYFVFLKNILHSLCPLVLITGLPCPGCGMTRAGIRVLKLDFYGAWKIHPFIYAIFILVIIFIVERYILQNKKMTVLKWCAIFVIIGMILFYVWRMITFFPDVPPMTYYRYNLLERIKILFY